MESAHMASALWTGQRYTYLVALHGQSSPSDEEWDHYCRLARSVANPEHLRGFTITLGGGPDSKQRKKLSDQQIDTRVIGAIVSDQALVRGIVTALGWLTSGSLKAFSFNKYREAFGFVELNETEIGSFVAYLVSLGETLEPPNPAMALKAVVSSGVAV